MSNIYWSWPRPLFLRIFSTGPWLQQFESMSRYFNVCPNYILSILTGRKDHLVLNNNEIRLKEISLN